LPSSLTQNPSIMLIIRSLYLAQNRIHVGEKNKMPQCPSMLLTGQAKLELGLKEPPPLVMLANESRQVEAKFVQSQLINNLGLDVKVDKQTFKQSLVKFRQGEFDLARSGCCDGALQYPVFFAEIFDSNSPYNDMNFENARYDRLMKLTHETEDQQVRMQAFGRMQEILHEQVPVIPH